MCPPPDHDDRRKHDRRVFHTHAQVVGPDNRVYEAHTHDIGLDGMSIVTALNPKANAQFRVRFLLPGKGKHFVPVEAPVQVVHSVFARHDDGFRVGLRYVQLDPAAAAAIGEYLQTHH